MFAAKLFLLLCILTTALAENKCSQDSLQNQPSTKPNDLLFSLYLKAYDKEYCDDQEYKQRQNYFENSLKIINDLNKKYPDTKYGVNHMADWSEAERENLRCLRGNKQRWFNLKTYVPQGNAPDSLDYRESNLVTGVKDQKNCGSCYIFSAIGNIEGQYAKKYKNLISLSEQQGLDCDTEDSGCAGGYPHNVFTTLAREGGSVKEEDYPYKAIKGQCATNSSKIVAKITGGEVLKIATEEDLKDALYNNGPLSIGMNADNIMLYSGGVVDPECDPNHGPNHALVLVGYGTDNGKPFWLIKNSWSSTWGESGYLRLIRGKKACNILDYIATAAVA